MAEGGLGAVARVRGQIDLRVGEGDLRESVRVVGSEGEELADRFESMGAEFVLEPGADPAVPGHERFFDRFRGGGGVWCTGESVGFRYRLEVVDGRRSRRSSSSRNSSVRGDGGSR